MMKIALWQQPVRAETDSLAVQINAPPNRIYPATFFGAHLTISGDATTGPHRSACLAVG
ncbi:MAG: hypothetical protein K0U74_10925 [Alphaproteobacteria bacterium]|nr:hypothetical protein [Alphaproteobacteria bacterium]